MSDVANVFLELLTGALADGVLTLADDRDSPLVENCVGWTASKGEAMLHPERSFQAIQAIARKYGIALSTTPTKLWKEMSAADLLLSRDQDRNTRKLKVNGKYQRVVHVRLPVLNLPKPEIEQAEPDLTKPDPAPEPQAEAPAPARAVDPGFRRACRWIKAHFSDLTRQSWTVATLYRGQGSLARSPLWPRAKEVRLYPAGVVGFEVQGPHFSRVVNVTPAY